MLTTVTVSVWLAVWASEAFFFDKFYYYKSIKHGYWISRPPGELLSPRDFGKRGYDIAALSDFIRNQSSNTLGSTVDDKMFTIAVIGDSYVWGQGVKEEDRFVHILEEQLNKIKPTKIISLGGCGDSALDNYIKYFYLTKIRNVDLFIYGMVDNDLLLREQNLYDQEIQDKIISTCNKPIVFNSTEIQIPSQEYNKTLMQSWDQGFGNVCILKKILENIPKTNALFFNFDNNWGFSELLDTYTKELVSNGFTVVSPTIDAADINKLHVSKKDSHPSAYANFIFARTLYEEIIKLDYFRQ